MKVWWCETHGSSLRPLTVECWIGYNIMRGTTDDLCQMVERLLIDEALAEKVPWCERHNEPWQERNGFCEGARGWRLLIPELVKI